MAAGAVKDDANESSHWNVTCGRDGGAIRSRPSSCRGSAVTVRDVRCSATVRSIRDLAITRNIRRAMIKDKSLSMDAHNITIITKAGKVTLKGRVKSDAEKQTVESAATNVAGPGNVSDELTVSH